MKRRKNKAFYLSIQAYLAAVLLGPFLFYVSISIDTNNFTLILDFSEFFEFFFFMVFATVPVLIVYAGINELIFRFTNGRYLKIYSGVLLIMLGIIIACLIPDFFGLVPWMSFAYTMSGLFGICLAAFPSD